MHGHFSNQMCFDIRHVSCLTPMRTPTLINTLNYKGEKVLANHIIKI